MSDRPVWGECNEAYLDGYRLGSEGRDEMKAQRDELARVLLAVEWYDSTCPRCGRYEHEDHATDCALDAALRKAGVR